LSQGASTQALRRLIALIRGSFQYLAVVSNLYSILSVIRVASTLGVMIIKLGAIWVTTIF